MPTKINIDSSRFDALQPKLADVPAEMRTNFFVKAGNVTGLFLQELAQNTYPPAIRRLPQAQNWTPAQRRFWWWVMNELARNGGVDLPSRVRQNFLGYRASYRVRDGVRTININGYYLRTNLLVRSLTYNLQRSAQGVMVDFGSNVDYAPFVIGDDDEQSDYHRGNWVQLGELIADRLGDISDIFVDEIMSQLAIYLGGTE